MVTAKEVKAEVEVYRAYGIAVKRRLIERAVAVDQLAVSKETSQSHLENSVKKLTPIYGIRKGAQLHVPSDYVAVLYTEEKGGVCRLHGIYEYSEPEAPHKIEELPELRTKGIIWKRYDVKVVYVKTDREDFDLNLLERKIYRSADYDLSVLTTDLLPIYYRVFRLEVQVTDVTTFLIRLAAQRVALTYESVKGWLLQELHWILNETLSKYDLINAMKDKLSIQRDVEKRFSILLNSVGLELLSLVWDYDIDSSIRDRYFWLHVQKVPPEEVLKMETLLGMARELAKSPTTAGAGAREAVGLVSSK